MAEFLGNDCHVISPGPRVVQGSIDSANWTTVDSEAQPHRVAAIAKGVLPVCQRLPINSVCAMLERQAGPYAIVHLDTLGATHLAGPLRRRLTVHGRSPTVVGSINDSYSLVLSAIGRRRLSPNQLKTQYVRAFERLHLPRCDVVHVVADRDRIWLSSNVPRAQVTVIPLGIHTAKFRGPRWEPRYDVLYLGSCSGGFTPFVMTLLTEVLPAVKAIRPNVRVALAGPDAPPEVVSAVRCLRGDHLGFVEDHSTLLRSVRMLVVPSDQRSGTPTKALEAMAAGTPVVGLQALEGVPGGVNDIHYSQAGGGAELVTRIIALLDNDEYAARIGSRGRALIEHQHDWTAVMQTYLRSVGDGTD